MATHFFWDPLSDNILQERDDTGAVTASYTTEPGEFGNVISQHRGGVNSQYHFDGLGSTLALTDDNQNVTDTYAYNAFGEVTEQTGNTVNPFQYVGQKGYYKNNVTGGYEVRKRRLLTNRGRWASADPLSGYGHNRYWYADNNSIVYIDPSGAIKVKTLTAHLEKKCGETPQVEWDFDLDKPAPCDGYIVQQVEYGCVVKLDCKDCPEKTSKEVKITYWEAFYVKAGQTQEEGRVSGDKFTDRSNQTSTADTCGFVNSRGTIKFFCKKTTGDLGKTGKPKKGSGWEIDKIYGDETCAASGGSLPTTDMKPKWWDNKVDEETGARSHRTIWNCCSCPGSYIVTSAATPKTNPE